MEPPPKKQKTNNFETTAAQPRLSSLSRSVSPPPKSKNETPVERIRSPWQLTRIQDLPGELNKDTVTLKDILGHPLIKEAWIFNYLHDVPWVMSMFDPDIRALVKVYFVHGFRGDDPRRLVLEEMAHQFANVKLRAAPMPEMFGTHHSKLVILLRHDDTAQVVILTANMIPKDWTNLTNGVWSSPLLPMLPAGASSDSFEHSPVGSGERFQHDLLQYLGAYNSRWPATSTLISELKKFDFSSIKAALIASVPGRHIQAQGQWGWPALKRSLRQVPCRSGAEVVIQISSIATLGIKDTWLRQALFPGLSSSKDQLGQPRFKFVFPTADEIRMSLDGYDSGGSIHTKAQFEQHKKQLQYLRPMLCHWANDSPHGADIGDMPVRSGGRERAAPHIKTYIRYANNSIDWALLTSANVSTQAWGAVASANEVRISSWEIGVLVWPELIKENGHMVPTFNTDVPPCTDAAEASRSSALIGVRVPYNLPLQRYTADEVPWVASQDHREPDRFGRVWVEGASM